MRIFNQYKSVYSLVPLLLITFLTGCYMERDINTARPWKAEAQQTTSSLEILFSRGNLVIGRHEQLLLKEYIDQATIKGPVYARLKVRKLHQKFDDPTTDPRIAKVIKLLKKYGVDSQRIEVMEEEDSRASHCTSLKGVWVGIDTYRIKPIKCPGFDAQIMDGRVPPEGESNFGCVTEANFAAMLVEPRDLHHGRELSSSDPVLAANAIDRLRTNKVKDLKIEKLEASSGTSSGG